MRHVLTTVVILVDTQIVCGTLGELLEVDFGAPLHCLVIVGETHPVEKEVRLCRFCFCISEAEFGAYGTVLLRAHADFGLLPHQASHRIERSTDRSLRSTAYFLQRT
jgi:hypothetical protein